LVDLLLLTFENVENRLFIEEQLLLPYSPSCINLTMAAKLNRTATFTHRTRNYWSSTTMNNLKKLEDEVSAWPNISIHPHRFGGREFRFGSAEVGHVHAGGIVDIPFPRSAPSQTW
jgi:hypothetical protein